MKQGIAIIILAAVLVGGLFVGQALANDFLAETQDYNAGIILKQQVAVMPNPNIIPPMLYPIFLEKSGFYYPDGTCLIRLRLYKLTIRKEGVVLYYFRETWYLKEDEKWIDEEGGWYNPRKHALYDLNLWRETMSGGWKKEKSIARDMTSVEKEVLWKQYNELLLLYQEEPDKFLSEDELPLQ